MVDTENSNAIGKYLLITSDGAGHVALLASQEGDHGPGLERFNMVNTIYTLFIDKKLLECRDGTRHITHITPQTGDRGPALE